YYSTERHTRFYLSFFFYSSVRPRDLHSFPTRRSSDLIRRYAKRLKSTERTEFLEIPMLALCRTALLFMLVVALSAGSQSLKLGEDRKSTRLNSSHSQISYAVFCLKKKIEHDADT